jgi:hypothetical protein
MQLIALLANKDIFDKNNIIVVNWGKLTSIKKKEFQLLAITAGAMNAKKVALKTIDLLKLVLRLRVLKTLADVHIIGIGTGSLIGEKCFKIGI